MSRKIIIFLWRQIEIANLQKYVGRNQSPRVAFLQSYKFHKRSLLRLSVGTVITKEIKEPDNRVLPGALLIGCIVSFVVRSLCLGSLRSKRFCVISEQRYPGCQRLFQRGFRFLSSLYSDPRFSRGFGRRPEDVSAFGQHRRFPPHARKTSGTQGRAKKDRGGTERDTLHSLPNCMVINRKLF